MLTKYFREADGHTYWFSEAGMLMGAGTFTDGSHDEGSAVSDFDVPLSSEVEHEIRMHLTHDDVVKFGQRVMGALEEHGASIVPHLLDSDENDGQRFRTALLNAQGGRDAR